MVFLYLHLVIKIKFIIHFLDSHPSKVIDNAKNSFGELSLSWFTAFSWPMKQIPHDFSIQNKTNFSFSSHFVLHGLFSKVFSF
jgi:hypothetical protein